MTNFEMAPVTSQPRPMKKRKTKHEEEKTEEQKVVWPCVVRTGSEASRKNMALVVNNLSEESRERLWGFIRKEDAPLASILKQVKIFETREYQDKLGNIVTRPSRGFGVSMTLCPAGAELQRSILQQEQGWGAAMKSR